MKDETLAIHAGYVTDPTTKSVAVPIYQTVAYEFDNAQHGADLFNLAVPGNIYTRIMNPTNDVLEQRVAALEGGLAGLALASGMAAVNYSILTIAALIDDRTAAVFCESIGNPAGNIPDLEAIAAVAHARGVPVIVDNTVP